MIKVSQMLLATDEPKFTEDFFRAEVKHLILKSCIVLPLGKVCYLVSTLFRDPGGVRNLSQPGRITALESLGAQPLCWHRAGSPSHRTLWSSWMSFWRATV